MPWQAERATINQKIQVGVELTTALGTPVACPKLLECFDFQFTINGDVNTYTPTGHKYPNVIEENTEWIDGVLGGNLDYNGVIYPLAGVCGSVAPVAHGTSTVAKDWIFIPPVYGPSLVPQTYTFQQGDSVRAHQLAYALFTEFTYKGTRKNFTCSGKLIAQPLTDGITLTASPTAIAVAPVVAKQANVYADLTSAGLGVTLLTRVLSIDYAFSNLYGPLWVINRATLGWTAHVDLLPKAIFKLKLETDVNGMAFLSYLQNGTTVFIRVNSQGAVIDNNQTVTLGPASAGTFTLTYKGQTTSAIAYNATGATVQTAFLALSTVGAGNATVTGGVGGPYVISMIGTLINDATVITGSGVGLTGGAFVITQTQIYNTFQHDMATKVSKPTGAYADDQGVFALEWELDVIEDFTWGKAQVFTCTNLLTAL